MSHRSKRRYRDFNAIARQPLLEQLRVRRRPADLRRIKSGSNKDFHIFVSGSKMRFCMFNAMRSQSYFSDASALAFLTMRAVKVGFSMYFFTARAIDSGSRTLQKIPVGSMSGSRSGSKRKSGMPPTGVATTGIPAANASTNALPIPSMTEG